jgi:hypothetical protein
MKGAIFESVPPISRLRLRTESGTGRGVFSGTLSVRCVNDVKVVPKWAGTILIDSINKYLL